MDCENDGDNDVPKFYATDRTMLCGGDSGKLEP
jgi:hypothetical protein